MNPQMQQSKDSTSSNTSKDSGVIIIDNTTTFTNRQKDAAANSHDAGFVKPPPPPPPSQLNATKAKESSANAQAKSQSNCEFNQHNNINKNNTKSSISIENSISVTQQPHSHSLGNAPPTLNSTKSSPSLSIRSSSRISIISIDENAPDSSVVDSDSDQDAEGIHANYTVRKLGQQTSYAAGSPQIGDINKGLTVLSQTISPALRTDKTNPTALNVLSPPDPASPSQIASIALTNSTDVTFGDKHFYEGPVTIQQFLIDNREKHKSAAPSSGGEDNPSYTANGDEGKRVPNGTHFKSYDNPLPEQPYKFICKRKALMVTGSVILCTIIAAIVLLVTPNIFGGSANKTDSDDSDAGDQPTPYHNGSLLILSRKGWHGRAQKKQLDKLQLPVHRVIIMHTATEFCESIEICSDRVRNIQDYHMDSFTWDDIGYNFLIGGDAIVYMGRGWDDMGANVKGYNVDSVGVAFIGTYSLIKPKAEQLKALDELLEDGIKNGKLVPDYRLYGARQLSATESPGNYLYDAVKNMTHWSVVL